MARDAASWWGDISQDRLYIPRSGVTWIPFQVSTLVFLVLKDCMTTGWIHKQLSEEQDFHSWLKYKMLLPHAVFNDDIPIYNLYRFTNELDSPVAFLVKFINICNLQQTILNPDMKWQGEKGMVWHWSLKAMQIGGHNIMCLRPVTKLKYKWSCHSDTVTVQFSMPMKWLKSRMTAEPREKKLFFFLPCVHK